MSFEEAASVPLAALTSWRALFTDGRMKPGQRVLVIGGSGSCGMFGVQIAKAFGAKVTAVCGTDNVAMVRDLGADQVIDYREQRFQDVSGKYDLIYDTIGKESPGSCREVLRPGGRYVTTVPSARTIWDAVRTMVWPGRKARVVLVRSNGRILSKITGLIEENKIRAVIDRVYPLDQAEDALAYSRTFHTKGKLVLTTDK
jgi:NADPH:quinone reductase-like Zn-dependent oxidoreductase